MSPEADHQPSSFNRHGTLFGRLNTPKILHRLKSVSSQKPKVLPPSPAVTHITPSTNAITTSDPRSVEETPPEALIQLPVAKSIEQEPEEVSIPLQKQSSPAAGEMSFGAVSRTPSPTLSNRAAAISDKYGYEQRNLGSGEYTETTRTAGDSSGDEAVVGAYDLKAPPPSMPLSNLELLTARLFSVDHLRLVLQDQTLAGQFHGFLLRYRPASIPILQKYLDTQKVISAVEYANALAKKLSGGHPAVSFDSSFDTNIRDAVEHLVNDSLTGFITHKLTILVTDVLVKEITGQNTPVMRDLVQGLAEVYCLTDPSLPDNPIVYASEEFYRATQYGTDYVIGRNCRFLQGPKSSGATVQRLIDALTQGQEICETILNYRRDGSPFVNLLLIAPLYDNKGVVRYFIGAQIDVSGLIENGHGIESFERLLAQDRGNARFGGSAITSPQQALSKLSSYWNQDEVSTITKYAHTSSGRSGLSTPTLGLPTGRRVLGMGEPDNRKLWPEFNLGPSGRLPGVFQNYLLVRPAPSLRITFTSPALRIPGLLQAKFLDCIVGPANVRDGLLEALSDGVGVTAKVSWLNPFTPDSPHSDSASSEGSASKRHVRINADETPDRYSHNNRSHSRRSHTPPIPQPRWIHCTPLLGSDNKIGVWMVVMVENEIVTGSLHTPLPEATLPVKPNAVPRTQPVRTNSAQGNTSLRSPISPSARGVANSSNATTTGRIPSPQLPKSAISAASSGGGSIRTARIPSPPLAGGGGGNKLYAEYLRLQSQGQAQASASQQQPRRISGETAQMRMPLRIAGQNQGQGQGQVPNVVPGRYQISGQSNNGGAPSLPTTTTSVAGGRSSGHYARQQQQENVGSGSRKGSGERAFEDF